MSAPLHNAVRAAVGVMPDLFGEIIVDLFAGGGGMSLGIEHATGRCVDEAVNHDADAIWMHQTNHPNTRHHRDSVWQLDPLEVSQGRPVGLLHGSPDCTHFSIARGGKPVKKEIRGLAWCVLRWTAKLRPRVLTMENVREFLTWGPLVHKRAERNNYLWEARDDRDVKIGIGDGSVGGSGRQALRSASKRALVQTVLQPDGRSHGDDRGGLDARKQQHSRGAWRRSGGSTRRGQQTGRTVAAITGPHADDGSARAWIAALNALGYAVEPLMVPDRRRSGVTFAAWKRQLEDLGYKVEHQVLDAADYGAPTHRRRLFIVARRDGRPIRWPEKTHGGILRRLPDFQEAIAPRSRNQPVRHGASGRIILGDRAGEGGVRVRGNSLHDGEEGLPRAHPAVAETRRPFRTAAECIERFDNCPSIFGRKKDLAENTLRRIVRGLVKFTIEADDPFIVQVNHGGDEFRGQTLAEPFPTISSKHGFGLLTPFSVGAGGRSPDPRELFRPLGTILPRDWPSLVAAHLIRCAHGETSKAGPRWGSGAHDILEPLGTVTGSNDYAVASAFLYDRHRERRGQLPRVRDLARPLGVIDTTGNGGNLVVPYLYTNVIGTQAGQRLDRSLGAITTVHNKFQLVTPYLVRHRFGEVGWVSALEPLQTICAQGNHFSIVTPSLFGVANTGSTGRSTYTWDICEPIRTITSCNDKAVLAPLAVKFYQSGIVKPVDAPLDSITSRDRFGLASAWLVKHYGGNYKAAGIEIRQPVDTITAVDHHAVATAFVTHLRGTHGYGVGGSGLSMFDLVPTLTSGGGHLYLTKALLHETIPSLHMRRIGDWNDNSRREGESVRRNGVGESSSAGSRSSTVRCEEGREDQTSAGRRAAFRFDVTVYTARELRGPSDSPAINRGYWKVFDLLRRFLGPNAPAPIVRRRDEFGDVVEYLIHDLGMRMLTPRELLNAQFGPELAKDYVLTGTRESQVAKIGNSVPPLLGAAVVRANFTIDEESGVAA